MNMLSNRWWRIFTSATMPLSEARAFIALLAPGREEKVLSFPFIQSKLWPMSSARILLGLQAASRRGLVSRRFRVRSPGVGTAAQFDSWEDIPETIIDPLTDTLLTIEPNLVDLVYVVPKEPQSR